MASPSHSPPRPGIGEVDTDRPFAFLVPFAVASVLAHGALLWHLATQSPPVTVARTRPVELVMVEVEPPKPVEPPKEEPPPPPKPVRKPPPIKVAVAQKPPPEPPKEQLPPPPNDAPPPETPQKPVPLVVGISMSSTTTAGSFSAAVGNTVYGKTGNTAQDPSEVKAYSAPKYAAIHTVDSAPMVTGEVKIPYPEEAKRAGIEGPVILAITVDHEGKVVAAKIVSGPGYGLNEAAVTAIRRFKFKPAFKGGEAVSTEMRYTYTFLLD